MANAEVLEDTRRRIEQSGPVELLIGVTGAVNLEDLRYRAAAALAGSTAPHAGRVVVSWPGVNRSEVLPSDEPFELLPYSVPPENEIGVFGQISAAQRGVLALAAELRATACLVLNSDMAALQPDTLHALSMPLTEKQCDLVLPIYASGRYDGLLNTAIVAPMTRALYGKRVRYPLPLDFAASGRYAQNSLQTRSQGVFWPLMPAVHFPAQIGQVHLGIRHQPPMEGMELTAVMAEIVSPLFGEAEQSAAIWQRTRGSQATSIWGEWRDEGSVAEAIDVKPMIDSFHLASRNLDELWSLVLPPVTLLELKRISRAAPEQFRIADAVWARIVYDFALAHRLRTISRTHLMGALAPLYLGWVASYMQETSTLDAAGVSQRQEQLARGFEEQKPYLVSRWRWPDRFNP